MVAFGGVGEGRGHMRHADTLLLPGFEVHVSEGQGRHAEELEES